MSNKNNFSLALALLTSYCLYIFQYLYISNPYERHFIFRSKVNYERVFIIWYTPDDVTASVENMLYAGYLLPNPSNHILSAYLVLRGTKTNVSAETFYLVFTLHIQNEGPQNLALLVLIF